MLKFAHKFGQVAVEMGFVTPEQVREVLSEQVSLDSSSRLRPPRLVGEIFFEKGWMTQKQIRMVMEKISLDNQ
ncbi:MAG: hypothetical protein HZA16_11805 [Nitrospirae bacterium]|nr:hypothetical protein [Nitrospirota bacterium]